jgi:hypothetical protein
MSARSIRLGPMPVRRQHGSGHAPGEMSAVVMKEGEMVGVDIDHELGVLSAQCLDRRIPDKQTLIDDASAGGWYTPLRNCSVSFAWLIWALLFHA